MTPEEVQRLLSERMPGCEISVTGDGRHFELVVIGDQFEGLRSLKRQQLIYGALNEEIASDAIHAVQMKIYTPQEWQSKD